MSVLKFLRIRVDTVLATHPCQTAYIIYCMVYYPPAHPDRDVIVNHLINTLGYLRVKVLVY